MAADVFVKGRMRSASYMFDMPELHPENIIPCIWWNMSGFVHYEVELQWKSEFWQIGSLNGSSGSVSIEKLTNKKGKTIRHKRKIQEKLLVLKRKVIPQPPDTFVLAPSFQIFIALSGKLVGWLVSWLVYVMPTPDGQINADANYFL